MTDSPDYGDTGATEEWVIARLRPHARRLVWPVLLLLAVAGGTGFGYGRLPEEWQNLAILALAAVLVLAGCLAPFLRWLASTYVITSERTIIRHGALVRSRQEVPHSRVRDIVLRRGALQAAFRSGDVILVVGRGHEIELRDVPRARLVVAVLDDLIDEDDPDDLYETSIG
ncbi:membrane protein YdbS with pleckstrin-like domain [Microbacteriaceae bacterium SG_E_30_P1]|uniref:Membrane protein YdbS with pleckstrin-like domain n=1 Tax=Antiquaquibacter oligotrophicus TaxID=2880260 RepID=A0ABT6KRL3_9MICO|nr:PH domain-containing protein [Antiquaquibacter oligotrophicus]MDH6181737.1 membrane protein YdbS with pleckstrin-like domain [Antiquaquibacter oligotrophicus]UDF12582.1 PH domain-containing protein [Antiquaquibacter oligotrophicus]